MKKKRQVKMAASTVAENWAVATQELTTLWVKHEREKMTRIYERYINEYIDEIFTARSTRVYNEFKTLCGTANSKTDLRVMLWEYSHVDVKDPAKMYQRYETPLGITYSMLSDYLAENEYDTVVTGTWVTVHTLVRKTNFLTMLAAKFGSDKFRVVKSYGEPIDENETFAIRRAQLWLEFYPFGLPKHLQ